MGHMGADGAYCISGNVVTNTCVLKGFVLKWRLYSSTVKKQFLSKHSPVQVRSYNNSSSNNHKDDDGRAGWQVGGRFTQMGTNFDSSF